MSYSQGGWKAAQVSWVKGEKYASGTAQDVYDLMDDIKTAILAVNIWELDPEIHKDATANTPILMDNTTNKWTHGLFFVNKQSGSKMCLTYTYRGSSFHSAKRTLAGTWGIDNYFGGMCCSLIPPNAGSYDYTQYSGRGFIPDKGIPIQSAFAVASSATYSCNSALYLVNTKSSSGWCAYTFLMKDDVIGLCLTSSYMNSGTVSKIAYYGHIFDDDLVPCPDLETDLPDANYGMVHLFPCVNGDEFYLSNTGGPLDGFNVLVENGPNIPGKTSTNGGTAGAVLKRTNVMKTMTDTEYYSVLDGCWVSQMPTGFGIIYPFYNNPLLQTATSDAAVFCEILVTAAVADNSVQSARYFKGDSSKAIFAYGTLRGDMVLAGNSQLYNRGQTFGDKKYIYVGGACAVGWDPDITVSLFG